MTDATQTDETQSDFPEAWKPNPGDTLSGVLTNVEVIDPGGNGAYPCVTVKTSDGTLRAIHAFHQVLRNGIARRRPKMGDELTITYHGKREGGAYGGYHSYAVTGGQDQEMNWDSWLPDDERRVRETAVPITPAVPQTPAQDPEPMSPDLDTSDVPF